MAPPVRDTSLDWLCAMYRAQHYASVYRVRYRVFLVRDPRGTWWVIVPSEPHP